MLLTVAALAFASQAYCHEHLNTIKARATPTISNSFVNLGKMEISFYYNGKPSDMQTKLETFPATSAMFPKPPVYEEPCPCSELRSPKDYNPFLSNPSELINKLLLNSDLFSFNKEPISSTSCCDSREHIHEETVYFDLSPNKVMKGNSGFSLPSFILDHPAPNRGLNPVKSKALEIFLFPKKKDMASIDYSKMMPKKKKEIKKDYIKVVGDKKPRNDIKKFILPAVPKIAEVPEKKEVEEVITTTTVTADAKTNAL